MGSEKTFICGGSLISELFVLTAAHCKNYRKRGVSKQVNLVRLNSTSNSSPGSIYRAVEEFYAHPNYRSSRDKIADIALVKLDRSVKLKVGGLRPACLWSQPAINKINASVIGWGYTEYGTFEGSDVLMKAAIHLVDISKCQKAFGENKVNEGAHICAQDLDEQGRDTCKGDSGGPIQILQPDNLCQMHIVGVTSFGSSGCGLTSSIGVYVKVSHYVDWIENTVWPQNHSESDND